MRLLYLLSFLVLLLTACEVDRDFLTGDAVELRFGTDTLRFDTVFTARGSATRLFTVYNDAADPVKIDRISVAGGSGVNFTFNADGQLGPVAEDVVIFGRDSIYIFVEVEVDPTQPEEVSPFIAEDRLVFETGSASASVVLEAFGQNANYLNGFRRGGLFQPICQDGTFTLSTDLPTVIYGSMFVDSCTLRMLAGTRVYFHGGIQRNPAIGGNGIFNDGFIYTLPDGRLELLGTLEDPILLATDRLEESFSNSTGGYRGLILGPGSRGNRIEFTEIRNSIVGVTVDSLAEVTITDSRITNSSGPAVTGYQSDITIRNSLFHSNFSNTIQVVKGGNLLLDQVTLANYGVDASALLVQNFACDENDECFAAPFAGTVRNSIIAGSRSSELSLADAFEGSDPAFFQLRIENSVVRTDDEFLASNGGAWTDFYTENCGNCYNLQFSDPLFVSVSEDDYRPDSLSVARDLGVFLPELPDDLAGNARDTESPDAGALEWQPEG
ncbi:right-handed parallel beta-helix repeat-containing protein [Lewinella sp. IMCC34183]|uniref:right-handed parallel beta-helix repeat-containing protein n=1 Tax=Lewinella sp. IMCC34183 TaxID=2248762 RepID=UPI000E2649CD|nr:right-handed parallel beta-helix repeat-containing protein [Lewinella sp. IMCC34183]